MKTRLKAFLLGLAISFGLPLTGAAQDIDLTRTGRTSVSLIMPFDNTAGKITYLAVSNPRGVSESGPRITTHWSYWDEDCTHLVDVNICLTLNGSIVVDTSSVQSVSPEAGPNGPIADLKGHRGYVTVTAYQTDLDCRNAIDSGSILVDSSISGYYTIANPSNGSAFGTDAVGLAEGNAGIAELPDEFVDRIYIQTLNPTSLSDDEVIFIAVAENGGQYAGEPGPIKKSTVTSSAAFFDANETRTSINDIAIGCAKFGTFKPGKESLFSDVLSVDSSGYLQLDQPIVVSTDPNTAPAPLGVDTFIYAMHGMALGSFGVINDGKFETSDNPPSPTPSPVATATAVPTPSNSPSATGTPEPTPTELPPTPTPEPTPTVQPTAQPSPTATFVGPAV